MEHPLSQDLAGKVILITGATDELAADLWALSERLCAAAMTPAAGGAA